MSSEELQPLKVLLEDIKSATDNFGSKNLIGRGGFGPVYKGEIALPEGRTIIAFKRLDPKYGQGNDEFLKEIIMLSKYKHENLVSLICFCDEGHERILGYEFASRGSLDRYLSDTSLTWTQRIKICIGVARALDYLHDPKGTKERVLHRDIKSSNILLDEKWTAKVSDFGLSKISPANQPQTYLFSNVVGTPGYCDPLYWELGFLTKESDVYSFGVVLFEVICGRLCCEYHNGMLNQILVPMWKNRYDENRLDDIVSYDLKRPTEWDSLMTFSAIASRCLNRNRKERPTMKEIAEELEVVLEKQKSPQISRYLFEFGKLAEPPLSYKSQEEFLLLLSKGFLYKDTKWLSIDKSGRVCEMISAIKCITVHRTGGFQVIQTENSRFDKVMMSNGDFKVEVNTQFLVPHVTYTINLIFKLSKWDHGTCVPFKYKMEEESDYYGPFVVELREDGWLSTQLYQFTCYQQEQHFIIECLCLHRRTKHHILEGIELRPEEYETEENNKVNIRSISNSDTYWKQKLPSNYIDLMKLSKGTIQWTTKKELYFLLRQGFLIENGGKWLSIKNMKIRVMIPARAFLLEEDWIWKSFPTSRFEVVAESRIKERFLVKCEINSQLLSPQTTYSCHLIYKLPENYSLLQGIVITRIDNYLDPLELYDHTWYAYLIPRHTPVIGLKVDEMSHIPSHTSKTKKGHPKLRNDGWLEFQFFKVSTGTTGTIQLYIGFESYEDKKEKNFSGLVVQGIEFRPF